MMNNFIVSLILVVLVNPFVKSQTPTFHWAKQISGSAGFDFVEGVVSDKLGNTYSTGHYTGNTDFDPGPGTFTLTSYGSSDVFILKLDPSGNLVWAKGIGGTSPENAQEIWIDKTGNIFVIGTFGGVCDFDPGPSTYTLTSGSLSSIFVAKYNPLGNIIWAKQFGGTNGQTGNDIEVDASGNIYTTGYFEGVVDFDPGPGTFTMTSIVVPTPDIFVSKLDSNGNFLWAKQVGGMGADYGHALALDKNNNVLITGYFDFSGDFDPGPGVVNLTCPGGDNGFALKLDSLGNYVWAFNFGINPGCYAFGVDTDTSENVIVCGTIGDVTDFDPSPSTYTLTSPTGSGDTFIAKYSSSGNFIWARAMEGLNGNTAYDVTTDQLNNVYATGFFQDTTDLDPGPGVYKATPKGNWDVYAIKIDPVGNFNWAVAMGGKGWENGQAICTNILNEVFVGGYFDTIVDFDPGPGTFNLVSAGTKDAFIVKLSNVTTTGIYNFTTDRSQKIYPNPFTSFLFIEIEEQSEITITNVLGQEIINEKRNPGKQILNLQDQPNGIYFVKIIQEGRQYVCKTIKE